LLLFIIIYLETDLNFGHAAQKLKLHNLQYDEGGNLMAEAEAEAQRLTKSYHLQHELAHKIGCRDSRSERISRSASPGPFMTHIENIHSRSREISIDIIYSLTYSSLVSLK
jgi:hypothetical protein